MDWLRIQNKTLRGEAYISCDTTQRSTWLSLMGYCTDKENSGVIKNCKDWGNRRWLQAAGVELEEVELSCALYKWVKYDLHIHDYPMQDQEKCVTMRALASKGGKASGVARRKQTLQANALTDNEANGRTELELEKELEGEREVESSTTSPTRMTLIELRAMVHIGPAEDETFQSFLDAYSKNAVLWAIKKIREKRVYNGFNARPFLSNFSEWIIEHQEEMRAK